MLGVQIFIISSDEIQLKKERSEQLLSKLRSDLPDAPYLLYTYSELNNKENLHALENELIAQSSLFDGIDDPLLQKSFSTQRIIKLYLDDLNKTALQTLAIIVQRARSGLGIIIDLPRINASYKKIKPKAYTGQIEGKNDEAKLKNVFACLYSLNAQLEIIYAPQDQDLEQWIAQKARTYQLSLSADAIRFLAISCENNLFAIDQGLKLLSLSNTQNEIYDEQKISSIFSQNGRSTDYDLAQMVLTGKGLEALNILASLKNTSAYDPLGFALLRLDQTMQVMLLCKAQRIHQLKFRDPNITSFFMSHRILNFKLQNALLFAARNMPQQFIDYILHMLAKANLYYKQFNQEQCYRVLQQLCSSLYNREGMLFN